MQDSFAGSCIIIESAKTNIMKKLKSYGRDTLRDFVRKTAAILFAVIVCLGFFCFCTSGISHELVNREFVEAYFENIRGQEQYIEIYGGFQRLLGKKQIEDFTIFRTSYGRLVKTNDLKGSPEIEEKRKELEIIWDFLEGKEIPYMYIESPLPIDDKKILPIGAVDYSKENADALHTKLTGIQIFNASNIAIDPKDMFYKTDHHWSGDASFYTYLGILKWLCENNLVDTSRSEDSFERVAVKGFLGSYGVKVGKLYNGTEDFVFFRPKFPTDITYEGFSTDSTQVKIKNGDWFDALMDQAILEDPDYNNKYNAALWGNPGENRITNLDKPDGKKLLLISHSYGRPLAQYFALDFAEVRQIDPQEGRFEGNYIEYIKQYDPDVVLFLCEFEGEIIGNYKTGE